MYTDEDLELAKQEGIFSADSVEVFRNHMMQMRKTSIVDEENFRLISGFNDVFVVIASGLLLASIGILGAELSPALGAIGFAFTSWVLAEFFVLKRRMALPAIGLLLSFLAGIFAIPLAFSSEPSYIHFIVSGVLTGVAARAHWLRFKVPITVAAATVAGLACILAVILNIYPLAKTAILMLVFFGGIISFTLAMYWDASDKLRQTRHSDVAFWLHLISAPMLVHPIFSSLGILDGATGLYIPIIVVTLYVFLAIVSIAVDRRAIMVSALVYVVYAFSSLLEDYGMVSYSFAVTGVCIGITLLLLSAFWHTSRQRVLKMLPSKVQTYLPLGQH